MKKILIFSNICIALFLLSVVSQADTILSTDFSAGLPSTWTLVDSSGMNTAPAGPDGFTWSDQNPAGRALPYTNGLFMLCDSDWNSSATYRDMIITPILDCSNYTGVTLQFGNNFRSYGASRAAVDIRIAGGAWQNVVTYSVTTSENTTINISSYADGQSSVEIRFFYYDALYAYWWGVDNVLVTGTPPPSDDDISAVAIANPAGTMFVNSQYTPQVTVLNAGTAAQTFDVNLVVTNSVPEQVYNQTVTGVTLDPGLSTTVSFTPNFAPATVDNYTFTATVQNPGDQNPGNDVVSAVRNAILHYGVGGPDAFGNTWKDNTVVGGPTFSYIDIRSGGTVIGNGDDTAFGPFPVGFDFPFYDAAYNQFYVNTNGLITMTASTNSRNNYCPVPGAGEAAFWITPFWDDLNVRSTDGGNMYYQFFDAAVDYVVIQWYNFSIYGVYGEPMDAEAILYADGKIVFQYNHVNNLVRGHGQLATVGIQKDVTDGLAYLCNDVPVGNELFSGLAIGWFPPVINHDIGVTTIDSPVAPLVKTNAIMNFAATFTNYGINPETFDVYLAVKNSALETVYADTVGLTIAVGGSAQATFTGWAATIPDNYSFTVTNGLVGDQNANNDMIARSIKAVDMISMPVNQDFEAEFPPAGWTILDRSGTSSWTWTNSMYRSATHSAQVSYDWLHNTDDWLVLAPIDMSAGTNIKWAYFEAQEQWATHGLRHSMYVSNSIYFDPATATPIAIQTPADHSIAGFAGDPVEFDLSGYAGSANVWLAFRQENAQGPNTEYWWIDDVSVLNGLNADAGLYSIDSPIRGIVPGCDAPVNVTIKNFGQQIQSFDVRVTIDGAASGRVYDNVVQAANIPPVTVQSIQFPNFVNPAADRYLLSATTMLTGDQNTSNDAMSDSFYASTVILHTWDDNSAEGSSTPYPFSNSMIATRFTPSDTNFTILGGNIYVNQYSPDGNDYAEWEWVKICPEVAGAPDIDNAFGTINNLGTYFVPVLIPVDIPDTVVSDYHGQIWIVAKYWDGANDFLSVATDINKPDGNSFFNQNDIPAIWRQVTESDYMMRIELEYQACGSVGACDYIDGDVNGSNSFNGLDVTYSVNYFKGGAAPLYSCECTLGNTWFVSGDVNGSCSFNGLDVTYMVNYFKGGAGPIACPDCPPARLGPAVQPKIAPVNQSN